MRRAKKQVKLPLEAQTKVSVYNLACCKRRVLDIGVAQTVLYVSSIAAVHFVESISYFYLYARVRRLTAGACIVHSKGLLI